MIEAMVDSIKRGSQWRRLLGLGGILLLLSLLCSCYAGIYHTVKPGQNLYRISKTYGVNESYLARINGISDPTRLPVGTRLYIPGATRALSVPVLTRSENLSLPKVPSVVVEQRVPKSKSARPNPPPLKKTPPKKATETNLHWPLRGKIVRSFIAAEKTGGGKGIEIAVRSGSTVTAAAAGKVIYSGDGVKGYGHLIILQHENDLFTVYGFNQQNLVQNGDFVSQGEKIALTGTPPSGGQPRMHFEVRQGKVAVNPILYLP